MQKYLFAWELQLKYCSKSFSPWCSGYWFHPPLWPQIKCTSHLRPALRPYSRCNSGFYSSEIKVDTLKLLENDCCCLYPWQHETKKQSQCLKFINIYKYKINLVSLCKILPFLAKRRQFNLLNCYNLYSFQHKESISSSFPPHCLHVVSNTSALVIGFKLIVQNVHTR